MKKLLSIILTLILITGCTSTEKTVFKTELGIFTPYALFPETLNGKIKKIVEKNYLTKEVDGKIVADRPLTIGDRDSIGWTNDFIAVFNEEGILLSCDELDENGKALYSTRLNIEGNKIVKAENYGNDTLRNYQVIHHDTNGWVDRVETFTPADTLKNTMSFKNDEKGNLLSVMISNPLNDKKTRYEFSYNDTDKRSGYIFLNAEGVKTFEQKFVYNDHGFMEKQFVIDTEGKESISQYTYSYGEDGNWIECIGNEGKQTMLTKREIEYYQ